MYILLGILLNFGLFIAAELPMNLFDIQRSKFLNNDDDYELITNNDQLSVEALNHLHFKGNTLVVDSPSIDFILVQRNDPNLPFFQFCGVFPEDCSHMSYLCYSVNGPTFEDKGCPDDYFKQIRFFKGGLYETTNQPFTFSHNCTKFYVNGMTNLIGVSAEGNATSQIAPYERKPLGNGTYVQLLIRVARSYCGIPISFPESSIAVYRAPSAGEKPTPPPIPGFVSTTTSSTTSTTEIPTTTTEEAIKENSLIIVIILVSFTVLIVIIIIVIVAIVIQVILKRRARKNNTAQSIPQHSKSLESLSLTPSLGPQAPFNDFAAEEKTQEATISLKEPKTAPSQHSRLVIVQPTHEANTAVVAITSQLQAKAVNGDKKEKSKETTSSEIPLPALTIDTTKKFTKLYKSDFDRGQEDSVASEENCGENIYKIDPFCASTLALPDQSMGTWPPDYIENMAVRASTIDQRASWHLQAIIMANNLLIKKGLKNVKGVIQGPEKSMEWYRNKCNISFVKFIAESIIITPDGTGPEFMSSKIQWRRSLKKYDVIEAFRQSCWLGQTKERREFFLLATYYKMDLLTKQYPNEDDLKNLPYPVPMFLEVRKEAPHYFEVHDSPSSQRESETKPPSQEVAAIVAAVNQHSSKETIAKNSKEHEKKAPSREVIMKSSAENKRPSREIVIKSSAEKKPERPTDDKKKKDDEKKKKTDDEEKKKKVEAEKSKENELRALESSETVQPP